MQKELIARLESGLGSRLEEISHFISPTRSWGWRNGKARTILPRG